jgi:type IV pilus assembly protein PilA
MGTARTNQGFSMIELLIVVAIILVIAAIAIPNYLQARIRANEAVAVANVRTLVSAQAIYNNMYPEVGFAPDIASLTGSSSAPIPGAAGIVSNSMAVAGHGYLLTITPKVSGTMNVGYTVYGAPTHPGITGRRGFCASESGLVTYSADGSNNCTTPVPF